MNVLGIQDLEALVRECKKACVSIYMPIHPGTPQVRQDSIQLKDLVNQAEEQLEKAGMRTPAIAEMLAPVRALEKDRGFWEQEGQGLAAFIRTDNVDYYRLPADFEPVSIVSSRFHIKPLLPLLSKDGQFYLLNLSKGEVRLFWGSRFSMQEIDVEGVPGSLSEALGYDDPEQRLQLHTSTRTPGGVGDRPATFHGQGVSDDPEKENIRRYLQRVAKGIDEGLAGSQVPLVVACVEYLYPIYEKVSTYPNLVQKVIEGNPEEKSQEQLREEAWSIVAPRFDQARERAANLYEQLEGEGKDRACNELSKVVAAAHFGRVEVAFARLDQKRWGTFEPSTGKIELHEDSQADDLDLLEFVLVETLLNGGTAYAVDAESVPGDGEVAAICRY